MNKILTGKDMYLFTAADRRKFLHHFMLVARLKHTDFPLAQNWSTGVWLVLEPTISTYHTFVQGEENAYVHSVSRSVISVPWKQPHWEAWWKNTAQTHCAWSAPGVFVQQFYRAWLWDPGPGAEPAHMGNVRTCKHSGQWTLGADAKPLVSSFSLGVFVHDISLDTAII